MTAPQAPSQHLHPEEGRREGLRVITRKISNEINISSSSSSSSGRPRNPNSRSRSNSRHAKGSAAGPSSTAGGVGLGSQQQRGQGERGQHQQQQQQQQHQQRQQQQGGRGLQGKQSMGQLRAGAQAQAQAQAQVPSQPQQQQQQQQPGQPGQGRRGLRNARSHGALNQNQPKEKSWRSQAVPPLPVSASASASNSNPSFKSDHKAVVVQDQNGDAFADAEPPAEQVQGKNKKYPQTLRRDPKNPHHAGPAGVAVGLGLRTDSGSDFFAVDQTGVGGVALRKKIVRDPEVRRDHSFENEHGEEIRIGQEEGLDQDKARIGPGLESLERLLSEAGYKETRVFTPEREGSRGRSVVPTETAGVTGTGTVTKVESGSKEEAGGKRLRLDIGLLNRRVELRNNQQQQQQQKQQVQQVVVLPLPASASGSAPVQGPGPCQQQNLRLAPSRSNLRQEVKNGEKRICSAPAVVPTLSARAGPSTETTAMASPAVTEQPNPAIQDVDQASRAVRATPPEHAIQRGKAEALQGLDWADIEDSVEEASPGTASGSKKSMMSSTENRAHDTPSPAMRYKATRLPTFDAAPVGSYISQAGGVTSSSEASDMMGETDPTMPTQVNVEELFGRREDGTLFYPPIAPRVRGYPGQPGVRNDSPVYTPATAYPSPGAHPQCSAGTLQYGQAFPNPHVHQYQYRPPVLPVAPLDPLPKMDMDVLTLRKMRSEADIKIREVERRAEAEEMGRGWKETIASISIRGSPTRHHEAGTSEISAGGTERKRRVLNRVELEFKSVDIDSLSDLSSEVDADDTNIDVIIREEEGRGAIFGRPVDTVDTPNEISDPASVLHASDSEERFDPAAYEDADDVDMVNEEGMYSSDDEPRHEEYAAPDAPEDIRSTDVEEDLTRRTYETITQLEVEVAAAEAFVDAKVTVSTPKSSKTAFSMASPVDSSRTNVDSPASVASRSSRDSVVRAKSLRHAMSTPLFHSVPALAGETTPLSKANVQRFTAVGLGRPSAPALPLQDSWLGKFSQRMWSAGTSVMTNSSKDDHRGPTKSAQRPMMPRAMTALVTAQRLPASPKVVRAGAIVCDSMESEDLPPVPISTSDMGAGMPFRALRTKLSLQMMGKAGQGMDSEDGTNECPSKTPTLTPRPDWHDRDAKWAIKPRQVAGPTTPVKQTYKWTTNIDEIEAMEEAQPDFSQSFFYKPATPPQRSGQNGQSSSSSREPKRQASIKSLRALLLKGVMAAKSGKNNAPPVPAIPSAYRSLPKKVPSGPPPPIFAISSPGAVEAGLPPRELVLEGEEWEGGSYESRKEQEKKLKKLKRKTSLRRNF